MRIGVVSDTHNQLRNVATIVELFNNAEVDQVIHTGDITQAKTLDVLSGLNSPMVGVFGNNDQERDSLDEAIRRHGFSFVDPPLSLCWDGRRIVVVHDPLEFDLAEPDRYDLALHGHTHLYRLEQTGVGLGQTLVFNPGECAGFMKGRNSIGVVDLQSLTIELLKF